MGGARLLLGLCGLLAACWAAPETSDINSDSTLLPLHLRAVSAPYNASPAELPRKLTTPVPFTPGNLVVLRVGAAGASYFTAGIAIPFSLLELTPAGSLVQTIDLPTSPVVDGGVTVSGACVGETNSKCQARCPCCSSLAELSPFLYILDTPL